MLNEKYIFWESELEIKIGKNYILRSSYDEREYGNTHNELQIVLKSEKRFTENILKKINKEISDVIFLPCSDYHTLRGKYAYDLSTDFFRSMYSLGQRLAKILLIFKSEGKRHYPEEYLLSMIINKNPLVNIREMDDKVEVLTRDQFKVKLLKGENFTSWRPLALSAVVERYYKKLPADLFLPDKSEFALENA